MSFDLKSVEVAVWRGFLAHLDRRREACLCLSYEVWAGSVKVEVGAGGPVQSGSLLGMSHVGAETAVA